MATRSRSVRVFLFLFTDIKIKLSPRAPSDCAVSIRLLQLDSRPVTVSHPLMILVISKKLATTLFPSRYFDVCAFKKMLFWQRAKVPYAAPPSVLFTWSRCRCTLPLHHGVRLFPSWCYTATVSFSFN